MDFVTALTILFIGLKLTGYIAWSWTLVLAPMWVTLLVGLVTVILILASGSRRK